VRSLRVVLLTNFVAPYRIPLFRALHENLRQLHILVSTPMEASRPWKPDWQELPVVLQRTLTVGRRGRHPLGFRDSNRVHVPYDTLWQLARIRPDVIIAGEVGARTVLSMLYRFWSRKPKVIVWATFSEVSELGRGQARRRVRSAVLPRADAIIVNGASGRRYVRAYGAPDSRIFTAPYTTDMQPFLALPVHRDPCSRKRLLYSGQLIERKGLPSFLSQLTYWAHVHPHESIEFWLVGDGPLRARLETSPVPRNLSLKFIGSVPYHDLPRWYAQAGILVLPTLADEWGLVVNEALASGIPVLGSVYSQAVEELVGDGENGWVFRPDRPGEMLGALDRALREPQSSLDHMRTRARHSVEHLTAGSVAECFLEAIRFVTARPTTNGTAT
jgi:glycosyltransferase involved in cell wall biosynthesis